MTVAGHSADRWGVYTAGDEIVDGWRMCKVIGRGGMSVVLEVSKPPLPRKALKILKPIGKADRQLFLRECALTARLDKHDHVVKVEDYGVLSDGSPYLRMELLDGNTLLDVIRAARQRREASRSRHPYLTAKTILLIVEQIALALGDAHELVPPIVHRDLKPGNVFLHRTARIPWQVKLLDFGIATVLDDHSAESEVMGTPSYMAPEVLLRRPPTVAVDIYSFAVLVYYLLTLQLPWREPMLSPLDVSRVHQQGIVPATDRATWIAKEVGELLQRGMDADPASRPALNEFLAVLRKHLGAANDGSTCYREDLDGVMTTDPDPQGLLGDPSLRQVDEPAVAYDVRGESFVAYGPARASPATFDMNERQQSAKGPEKVAVKSASLPSKSAYVSDTSAVSQIASPVSKPRTRVIPMGAARRRAGILLSTAISAVMLAGAGGLAIWSALHRPGPAAALNSGTEPPSLGMMSTAVANEIPFRQQLPSATAIVAEAPSATPTDLPTLRTRAGQGRAVVPSFPRSGGDARRTGIPRLNDDRLLYQAPTRTTLDDDALRRAMGTAPSVDTRQGVSNDEWKWQSGSDVPDAARPSKSTLVSKP
jgi:serine/threonine protein kinase